MAERLPVEQVVEGSSPSIRPKNFNYRRKHGYANQNVAHCTQGGRAMSHPKNRAERRHRREQIIAKRRFTYLYIWQTGRFQDRFQFMREIENPLIDIMYLFEKYRNGNKIHEYPEWGKYSKWNLNCDCHMCHSEKYDKSSAKRRKLLKTTDSDWEWQYTED